MNDIDIHFGSLAPRCHSSFDSVIRARGENYFNSDFSSKPILGVDELQGVVRGTKNYHVALSWQDLTKYQILLTCSCPYFRDGLLCKHLWAFILKIDQVGLGKIVPSATTAKIHLGRQINLGKNHAPVVNQAPEKNWLKKIASIQKLAVIKQVSKNPRLGYYSIELEDSMASGQLVIEFFQQETLQSGQSGTIKHARVSRDELQFYFDPLDREIMTMFLGISNHNPDSYYANKSISQVKVPNYLQDDVLVRMSKTGRLRIQPSYSFNYSEQEFKGGHQKVIYENEPKFHLHLAVRQVLQSYEIQAFFKNGLDEIALSDPLIITKSGLIVMSDKVVTYANHDLHFPWVLALRGKHIDLVPVEDGDRLVEAICSGPHAPPVVWPEALQWKQDELPPVPQILFVDPPRGSPTRGLLANVEFTYDRQIVSSLNTQSVIPDRANRRLILRNRELEQALLGRVNALSQMTRAPHEHQAEYSYRVYPADFSFVVSTLLDWGWKVETRGKRVKPSGQFDIKVSSGVDWFDLSGVVHFGDGVSATLPELLRARERGEDFIPLGDGTLGMLPTEWLKKYSALSTVGTLSEQGIQFGRGQGVLLAGWIGDDSEVESDGVFLKLTKALKAQVVIEPIKPKATFNGKLRPYQMMGFSWLQFLKTLQMGGILADDMGLGKTVQVLAHLDHEYQMAKKSNIKLPPTLVILPKSLIFNWQQEATKFTPQLKTVCYHGTDRGKYLKDIEFSDLVFVTYSTLRIDIEQMQAYEFHYVIADEAQAIKNSDSLAHMSCRLIRGKYRLAMTGTPVENSVEDLFSILSFVNPGLLNGRFKDKMSKSATRGLVQVDTLKYLSAALKPFILRRTKDQVLKDLPAKSEQILYCELSPAERKRYDALKEYYRVHLKGEISVRGFARSKIVILEALLRLRQAACHPGLIEPSNLKLESTKVETLLEQLEEISSEGHKALVFSQFTSFLDIVQKRLESKKFTFERLDGKTTMQERRSRVDRFQNDPKVSIFLLSLKAGGVGLNLTAADYVYILDPWWNPAVESQAIDRTHRIGQKNKVIAYRLIAKDTVEDKIVELQKSKRELAEAIISADTSLMRKLTLKDVEALLS